MTKPKDPKKVAAGKALAGKNKEAREAKKKLDEQDKGGGPSGFFDSISIGTVVGVGGLLLGGANLYFRWREDALRKRPGGTETPTQSDEEKTPIEEKEEPVEKKADPKGTNEMIGME